MNNWANPTGEGIEVEVIQAAGGEPGDPDRYLIRRGDRKTWFVKEKPEVQTPPDKVE